MVQYLVWHFFDVTRGILKGWKNYLRFIFNFFSLGALLKTLFAPWHQQQWSYGKGFSFARYAEVAISNAFSRIIGAIIRIFVIIFGIIMEILVFVFGGIIFLCWLFLPVILIIGFIFSIKILF